MAELERALERLERAVAALESAAGAAREDRARLASRTAELEAAAVRDAELRAEAADAVRSALGEMRALMPEDERHG